MSETNEPTSDFVEEKLAELSGYANDIDATVLSLANTIQQPKDVARAQLRIQAIRKALAAADEQLSELGLDYLAERDTDCLSWDDVDGAARLSLERRVSTKRAERFDGAADLLLELCADRQGSNAVSRTTKNGAVLRLDLSALHFANIRALGIDPLEYIDTSAPAPKAFTKAQ